MKRMMPVTLSLLFAALLLLPACQSQQSEDYRDVPPIREDEDTSIERTDDLSLVLDLPSDRFEPGETFTATITLKNRSNEPLEIEARSSALYKIHLMRPEKSNWQTFKTFPEMAAMVITPWTLPAGEQRSFKPELTVTEDWPTHELIRVQAEINGLPDLKTHVDIEVLRPE